jgi:hypothetical protein
MILHLAFGAWLAAASADVVTTAQFAHTYTTPRLTASGALVVLHEGNPLLRPFEQHPVAISAALMGEYAGQMWLAQRLARRHPRWAVAAMIAGSVVSTTYAARNVAHMRQMDALRAPTW